MPAAPRRGRPRLDAEPRRQRIVTAAAALFIEHGHAATTLEAVSKAARVTKRTIYEVIGDKDALLRAVCHQCFADISAVRLDVRVRDNDLTASLLEMAQWLINHAVATPTITLVRAVVMERMRSPELVQDVIGSAKSALYGQIAAFFEELAARDRLRMDDPLETANLFYDLVVGNLAFRIALGHDEPLPSKAAVRQRVEVFIRGHLGPGVPDNNP